MRDRSRRRARALAPARLVSALLLSTLLVLEVGGQQKNDHYKTLGVQKNANDREIKKAYHKVRPRQPASAHCTSMHACMHAMHSWWVRPAITAAHA